MGQRRLNRPRLPKYVHAYLDRHGKPRHYMRRPGRKEVALPGLPWSTEFMDAYQQALNNSQHLTIGIRRTKPGTVEEAVAAGCTGNPAAAAVACSAGMDWAVTGASEIDVLHRDIRARADSKSLSARLLSQTDS